MTTSAPARPATSQLFPREARYEAAIYRDNGCEYSPRCLDCPLPRCVYDLLPTPASRQQELDQRDLLIAEAVKEAREDLRQSAAERATPGSGAALDDIASRFGVSRRTVDRAMRRVRTGTLQSVQLSLDEAQNLTLDELSRRSSYRARGPWPAIVRPERPQHLTPTAGMEVVA